MHSTRWRTPGAQPDLVQELARAAGISNLTARVLVSRGLTEASAVQRFLRPSLQHLHDPFLLTGMAEAVRRLRCAIERREGILIYGDYDVDGTTSIAVLTKAIELAGGSTQFHVPHRLHDGYGMRAEVIQRAAETGIKLIVSVDTGIRASEVVRGARQLGIDVIVTDHHLPEEELPPAIAVLNPNRSDCSYPYKSLCGAGVALKLAHGLLGSLDWPREKLQRILESFLKVVAVATVADVVPLTGENRIIVKHGLTGLTRVHNPGLRALLEQAGLANGRIPKAHEIAFQLAPRMNAAGRMAHAEDVVRLFLTRDFDLARSLAAQLDALNRERQQTEAEVVRQVLEHCGECPVQESDAALVFTGANWHRGVVGIVASRLVERFWRPVFVLSEVDGEAHGSGRSIAAFHLLQALEAMPGLFTRFGGHAQAAGISLPADRINDFRRLLNTYAAERLTPNDFMPEILVDTEVELEELDERNVEELLSLAPFGFGNPLPVFVIPMLQVTTASVMKERHLRAGFRQGRRSLFVKGWGLASRLEELSSTAAVDAVISIEEDRFAMDQGWGTWSAIVKDFRPAKDKTTPTWGDS